MPRAALAILLLLALSLVRLPVTAQEPPSRAVREAVEEAIAADMARHGRPGLSVAVVRGHRLQWSSGFGLADVENHVPARAATVYRLASISKPITAVAALQLAEQGKLDLDAPVQRYVPGFPEKPWPVTARQLLGHLGGIRHYNGAAEVNSTRAFTSLSAALALFKDDPLAHEPGTRYLYTTYGYNLLGSVVEGAAGVPFPEYVRDRVFRPAGMDRIRPDDQGAIIPNRAQGYRRTTSGELRNSALADTSNKIPGGGFCSTAEDLARFAIAVQTAVLVKPETRELMWTRQKTRDGEETRYGLGWALAERNGKREVSHGGAQPRVSTLLYMLPEERFAVALMSNLEGAPLTDLARRIADLVLAAPAGG